MGSNTSEPIVAGGGRDDILTVRHLVMRGNQFDIGRELARIAIDRYGYSAPISSDPLMTEVNREYQAQVWPAHYQRMMGAAEELGVDWDDDEHDFREIFYSPGSVLPGCSNIYYPQNSNGHAMLSRNFDFSTGVDPMGAREPYLMEVYPAQGYAYLCMCAYDLLGGAMDGVNSEGLAVALLMDLETALAVTDPDFPKGVYDHEGSWGTGRGAVGVSEAQIVRFLLETCCDANEAKRALLTLLTNYKVVPQHYIIGDRFGNGFVFEGSMQGHLPRFNDCSGKPLPVTNHPIRDHELADHESIHESATRLERLRQRIESADGGYDLDFMKATSESVAAIEPAGSGQYISDVPSRTLWHGYYDLEEQSLLINFYLRDRDVDGETEIIRSPEQRFHLEV